MTNDHWFKRDVLITVRAYPNPSSKYGETACVAGVTREEGWVRLYPITDRDLPPRMRFHKYQWVSLRLCRHRADKRPESFRPDLGSVVLGEIVPPKNNWQERKKILLPTASSSMCEITRLRKTTGKSLGMFQPGRVDDLIFEDAPASWTPKQLESLGQGTFWSQKKRALERIPFGIKYKYRCGDAHCRGHTQSIIDWELAQLYRNLRDKHSDAQTIKAKIRRKFLEELCALSRDTYFFVGNMAKHTNVFLVLGVFYPRKQVPPEPSLFD